MATVKLFESMDELAAGAAKDIANEIIVGLKNQRQFHLVITGGGIGILTLGLLSEHLQSINLSNLHIWWGDERFVSKESMDRNANQAKEAFLCKLEIPANNIHEFPDSGRQTLDQAAENFAAEIFEDKPKFDLVLLGMGPDGHIASLFPGSQAKEFLGLVVAEKDSPKPPKERLSMSYSLLGEAEKIWFLVSGSEKRDALNKVLTDSDLPASKVHGLSETRWYVDRDAYPTSL